MAEVVNNKVDDKIGGESKVLSGKFLTFILGNENYAFPILKVQEIIGQMSITRVPKTPSFMRGIINLRGKVVPVIDLRARFNLDKTLGNEKNCIIVVQINLPQNSLVTGILVDEVSEVVDINSSQIEATPNFGSKINTDFISGIGKLEKKMVVVLDVEEILNFNETKVLQGSIEGMSN